MTKELSSESFDDTISIKDWRLNEWEELDENITSIDAWYDKHTKLWCIQLVNSEGCQVGDAIWVYGKKDAMIRKAELENQYGL